jgi:hypothetical protein
LKSSFLNSILKFQIIFRFRKPAGHSAGPFSRGRI